MGKKMMALLSCPGAPAKLLHLDKPDFAKGDAEYFDPASTERYQIRPLCFSDMQPGFTYAPGCWHLVVRTTSDLKIRATVPLPAELRENTPANALAVFQHAVRQQTNFYRLVEIGDSVPAAAE